MNLSANLYQRFSWINLPGALLVALLQRTPVLNVVVTVDEMVVASPIGAVLKSVVATVAALGAVNSLAGATPLVPTAGSATGITVAAGSTVSVFYTVNGTQTPPMSWAITGSVPPGLDFSGLTGPGTVSVGLLHLEGKPTAAGMYNLTIKTFQFTGGGGIPSPLYSYSITVTGSTATMPSFTTQPASQTVTAGSSVTFTTAASGSPAPTYLWSKGTTPLAGATSASYTIASVAAGDAGTYSVTATNSAGGATSNGAVLTVNPAGIAPAITTQPASQTAAGGSTVSFNVTANGTPAPTGQWQVSTNAGSTWTDLTETASYGGTTNDLLTITGVTGAMNGYQYRFVATNATGNASSNAAALTVVGLTDQAFLQQLFLDVLGRPIDSGGAASFGAALAGGESRASALGDLLGGTEYSLRHIEPAIRLYYAALARMPDYAGLKNWSGALSGGVLTLAAAGDQFASSAEFLLDYGNLDNTGYVQQLYRNVLGREADPAGLANWVGQLNAGTSRGTVLIGFSESPEFQADIANQVEIIRLYFLLQQRMPTATELSSWIGFFSGEGQTDTLFAQGYPTGLADSDYVQLVFQGFLRRPADSGALSTFGSALAAGTVTHGSLVETLLTSTEFNLLVAPVSRLYMAAFRRVPDAGGLDNWVAYVRGGNSLESAADAFVASPEFQLTYGNLDDTQYVTLLYENVLGRGADPTGLAGWVAQLGGGATRGQVLIGFSESPEGISLFAPTVRTFLNFLTFLNATPAQSDLDFWKNYLATLDAQFRATQLADPGFTNGF
jgi:hypothetical protein